MAAEAKAAGTTLVGRLDELARRDGLHATSQLSIRVEDLSLIDEMMQRLRLSPPTELIGSPVTSMQDLSQGSVATTGLPPTDGGSRPTPPASGPDPRGRSRSSSATWRWSSTFPPVARGGRWPSCASAPASASSS